MLGRSAALGDVVAPWIRADRNRAAGILMASFVDRDAERARRRWDRACEHLHVPLAEVLPVSSEA
ncbi:MAG TPA: hypothetical protein VKI00_29785 [Mycobacterium sp.]|uniref:hypothetical protein n=1 Tax=Mycobacterium sp. TaxID=1785 RepID=UPI002B5EBF07|nr:hypothetical protein [Mycobacterium sp.]HME79704.1 hypothetical protein [Mycobacterium sp.]